MFKFIILFALVIGVTGVLMHHWNSQRTIKSMMDRDIEEIRRCAEESVIASTTVSPVLSLVHNTTAIAGIRALQARHGAQSISDISEIDTKDMLDRLQEQHRAILSNIKEYYHLLIPAHPLAGHTRMMP